MVGFPTAALRCRQSSARTPDFSAALTPQRKRLTLARRSSDSSRVYRRIGGNNRAPSHYSRRCRQTRIDAMDVNAYLLSSARL